MLKWVLDKNKELLDQDLWFIPDLKSQGVLNTLYNGLEDLLSTDPQDSYIVQQKFMDM